MCKLVTIENSNGTGSKLYQAKSYNEFTNKLYDIDRNQDYEIRKQ